MMAKIFSSGDLSLAGLTFYMREHSWRSYDGEATSVTVVRDDGIPAARVIINNWKPRARFEKYAVVTDSARLPRRVLRELRRVGVGVN